MNHLIADQAIHESLLFLLEHLPEALHLVLASRVDPPLSLARLRVRGQMLELRDADLRFQQAEVASFLTAAMKLPLSEAEVSVLEQRTEGWIAGLLLAALALQQREDRSAFVWAFTGSQRYVLEYIQEEMLARLPVAVQRFLLHTAILNRTRPCSRVNSAPIIGSPGHSAWLAMLIPPVLPGSRFSFMVCLPASLRPSFGSFFVK